ncbi:hypothetical protein EDB81DRAFT_943184 [Dactylonectria macrodidyma]|uniref:TFIIIC transcription initiation factor complex subunits Tfc3 n=1 Tax=Dactylonectria macrodidyma TaxID=307937 RepID=A0A9P9FPE9_9HYPO|nr:hypothetical protein EDB81DRAFT_943184 [Dactylonectria macrodidyma]
MASELEGLIAALLVLISCGGEQGCSVSDLVDAIHKPSGSQHAAPGPPDKDARLQNEDEDPGFRHRTASTIWKWLAARRDVSIGPERSYNHLSLSEVLALSQPLSASGVDEKEAASIETAKAEKVGGHVSVYASEDTMWESLTGHSIDYKRVPRSEWLLLLGIASTTVNGILQGDLGRLVDQDKRSVPKRTDALLKKGYIAKRTTLVRGTKTSKMWLKLFAPPLPKDGDAIDEPRAEMNLSHQVLAANLDPVPWHIRWTGESVDYTALATTIQAVSKEWGVLRMLDLKSKLGVLGMRWQMKVLAKVCRFLNSRGVIQYVAAKLGDKVFKDCIKYGRDLNAEDWSIYLATGKRATKPSRNPELATGEGVDGKSLFGQTTNASEVASTPPWSLDKPLPATITDMAQRLGDKGLSNPDVYGLTLGPSFSRYLSSMTSALATPNLQPPHLKHFQLRSEHTRVGKIASYRYFAQTGCSPATAHSESLRSPPRGGCDGNMTGHIQSSSLSTFYGFSPVSASTLTSKPRATFTDLCVSGVAKRKPKGRPKRKQLAKSDNVPSTPVQQCEEQSSKLQQRTKPKDYSTRQQDSTPQKESCIQSGTTSQELETSSSKESPDTDRLVAILKVAPEALKALNEKPAWATPTPTRRMRTPRKVPEPVTGSPITTTADISTPSNTGLPVPKKRGRPQREKISTRPSGPAPPSRPWACEKCGGSWKNDIGLKYHLEKSRTPCNPSFDASEPTPRRGRKPVNLEAQDPVTPVAAIPDAPQTESAVTSDSGSKDRNDDSEVEEPNTKEPQLRKRPLVTPTLSSRPSVSLTGGPLQAVPEWRRPPALSFNTPSKISASTTNGGALVQSQDGQLRPVLGLFDRPKSTASTPRTVQKKKSMNESKTGTDETQLSTPEPTNELVGKSTTNAEPTGKPARKSVPPLVVDSLLPKVTWNSRISAIVIEMLEEQAGVFPGGRGLWHAITMRWGERFPKETLPTVKASQAALRDMFKTKTAAEHWHAFRDKKGFFTKCQIIVLGAHDPFSPEAMNLVEMIKEAYPQIYVPSPFTAPPGVEPVKEGRRGRRKLGDEVETLSAPVYVAQVAAKRAIDEFDADTTLPPKRRKARVTDIASSPGSPRKRTRVSWAGADQQDFIPQPMWSGASGYLLNQEPLERIQFLEPNTYLQEDTARVYKRRRLSKDSVSECLDPRLLADSDPVCMQFDKAISVVGSVGTWPYISAVDFETQDGSYTLEGWMPDTVWFSWAAIVEEIDLRTATMAGLKCQPRRRASQYHRFLDRLFACIDVERSWAQSFTNAPPNATGPHNIFVRFFRGRGSQMMLPSKPLRWLPEWQLTPESFQTPAQDDEGSEDLSSSDEDEPFAWPTFRKRMLETPRPYSNGPQASTRQEQPRPKRVQLVSRSLTTLPSKTENAKSIADTPAGKDTIEEPDRLLAAFIAVRVLLGGSDKAIDWGLLLKLFPSISLVHLRRFWLASRKEQGAYVAKLTQDFQDKFLIAYEKNELPEIDFDEPLECDWNAIIAWTLRLPRQEGIQLPSTRGLLDERFSSQEALVVEEDWREKFFHPQSSVFARFEAATAMPAALAVDKMQCGWNDTVEVTDVDVTRSWIRSLCCTDETQYSVQQIKDKFSTLANGDATRSNMLLKQAIDDLTRQRVICRSKKPPLGGRPYRLNESYTHTLEKLAQQTKYQEAAAFKAKLDGIFRRGETLRVPYTLDDGSVMALTNLNASERIKLVPVDVPHIPLGFEPGNYESRKFPKSYYHFSIEAVPTETYQYDEDIQVLKTATEAGPPNEGPQGELPQWIDFFGKRDPTRWMHILGAFFFIYATRGLVTIEGICSALKPVLEEFEAQMIIDWGKTTGVLKDSEDGLGVIVGEWWWLAVAWQSRDQVMNKV